MIQFWFLGVVSVVFAGDANKIKETELSALTLRRGQKTTGRRSEPVNQLQCVGGSANCEYIPDVVSCTATGHDGRSMQWKCEADMSDKYRFGELDVNCEGYASPDDEYILVGSCGLQFKLENTNGRSKSYNSNDYSDYESTSVLSNLLANLVGLIILCLFVRCIYSALCPKPQPMAPVESAATFPQPSAPPQAQQPYYEDQQIEGHPNSVEAYDSSSNTVPQQTSAVPQQSQQFQQQPQYQQYPPQQQNTQFQQQQPVSDTTPGFWSGMATGGVMGLLFGSRRNYSPYGASPYRRSYGGPFGWGRSSNGGGNRSFGRSSGGSSRSSSGFGGTSRR